MRVRDTLIGFCMGLAMAAAAGATANNWLNEAVLVRLPQSEIVRHPLDTGKYYLCWAGVPAEGARQPDPLHSPRGPHLRDSADGWLQGRRAHAGPLDSQRQQDLLALLIARLRHAGLVHLPVGIRLRK